MSGQQPNNNSFLGNSNNKEAMPMFQMSNPDAGSHNNLTSLDLDDLFMDCYFDVPSMGGHSGGNNGGSVGGAGPEISHSASAPPPAQPTSSGGPTSSSATTTTSQNNQKKRNSELAGFDQNEEDEDETGKKEVDDAASDAPLTDKQKLERRERNREHAKRSRLRKKFLLESLQEQIHGLQEQMDKLKDAIKQEIPQKADQILQQICGPQEKYTPLPMPSGFGPVKTLMEPDFRLMSALSGSQQNFAISDPTLPDNPIVYVSQGFLDLTGYSLDQVLGRNCRFLQGPGTDQSAVDVIRKGIEEGIDTSVCLLNYKADGTPFWNQFFVAALRDAENNVVNYVGVQCEVSKAVVEKHMGTDGKKR